MVYIELNIEADGLNRTPVELSPTLERIRRRLTLEDLDPWANGRAPEGWTPLWQQIVLDDRIEPEVVVNNLLALFKLSGDQLSATVVENLIELLYRNKDLADASAQDAIDREEAFRPGGFPRHGLAYLEYMRVARGIWVAIAELARMGNALNSLQPAQAKRFQDLENVFKDHVYPLEDQRPKEADFNMATTEGYAQFISACRDFGVKMEEWVKELHEIQKGSRKRLETWLSGMERPKGK